MKNKLKSKYTKYITVLDFEIGRVFQYKIKDYYDHIELKCGGTINKVDGEDKYEEFIADKGHRLNNCEWMVHDIAGIIKNNGGSYGKL